MTKKQIESCLSCKVISVACLLGIGGYLTYQGRIHPNINKYVFYVLGAGVMSLGVGEIFNKSPFRNN